MARQNLEEVSIVEGDLNDHDPEDLAQRRAYTMMPLWGQFLAWMLWELPGAWYCIVSGGLLWIFYATSLAWKIAVTCAALFLAVGAHTRRRVRSPFRYYVIVTRKLVPGHIADAAASGPTAG